MSPDAVIETAPPGKRTVRKLRSLVPLRNNSKNKNGYEIAARISFIMSKVSDSDRPSGANLIPYVSPLTLLRLEEHDESLRDIASQSCLDISESLAFTTADNTNTMTTSGSIRPVHKNELKRISLIGSGTFCRVHLMAGPSCLQDDIDINEEKSEENEDDDDDSSLIDEDERNRSCQNNYNTQRRSFFAVKSIDPNKIKGSHQLTIAASELATEAKILAELDHENIIQLRGVSSQTFSKSFASGYGGYFLVLDVLTETLADRLQLWRRRRRRMQRMQKHKHFHHMLQKVRNMFRTTTAMSSCYIHEQFEPKYRRYRLNSLYYRIEDTVMGIVKGMEYLHARNIVLRDLKPANIGYDTIVDGKEVSYKKTTSTVRLFDFGMAQKVDECDPEEICGTLRYMAPEVIAGTGYTLKVDVYSFGVILFEVCSLEVPFAQTTKQQKRRKKKQPSNSNNDEMLRDLYTSVQEKGLLTKHHRLEELIPCPGLRALVEECTDRDPNNRPSFSEIGSRLHDIFHDSTTTTTKSMEEDDNAVR